MCQIVPPYLLARLAEHSDEYVSSCAKRSLLLDARHRTLRASGAAQAPAVAAPGLGGAPAAEVTARRTVADAHGTTTLPGTVVRREGDPATGDLAADEAYVGLGATWTMYREVYRRDSLDGRGLPLLASVHYDTNYDNAFWDGTQMVFGDGDGQFFNRFTVSVDVVGHELTHGVTEKTAGLTYSGQSGALNESVSDVFGSLVKQRALRQDAAAADWLIGQGLFTSRVRGVALRSMKAPGTAYDDPAFGKDPQPATMDGYVQTTDDNGGVHTNSGIPNHAFYLAAVGIGGTAWEGAGQVWYDVLTGTAIRPGCDFATFAQLTVAAAVTRYGEGSREAGAVADAWAQVGLPVAAGGGGAPAPTPAPASAPTPAPPPAPAPAGTVRVVRSGGFAGRTVEREVDVDTLSDTDADAWRSLVDSSLLHHLTEELPQPDRYVYRVVWTTVGIDVTAAEQQLPEEVRTLLERTLRT